MFEQFRLFFNFELWKFRYTLFCFNQHLTLIFHNFPATFVDEEDLNDVLCEFDAVMEDFASPLEKRHFRYDEHLKTMKRRSSASVSDSGFSDSESKTSDPSKGL